MNHRSEMLVALLMGLSVVGSAEMTAPASKEKPAVFEAAVVSLKATVKDIDYKNRTVTLQKEDGEMVSMDVGPEAVRFNEVKKDDVVEIDYMESIGIVVQSPDAEIATAEGSNMTMVRNQGKKPSGVAVATDVVTATVVKIDAKTRKATLKGPQGNTFDIDVAPDVENLKNVKKGDQVMVKYTRTLAIDVRKPSAKK